MRILIACEESGRVRDAFIKKGHDAMSCDLLPTAVPGSHYQGDVNDILGQAWDMIIAFPPCTHLSLSGARHFAIKISDGRQQQGIDFFMLFANHPCERIVIENPVGIMSSKWRKPDQIIQPWQFGHEAQKTTCLWLKNLPLLKPTNIVGKGEFIMHKSGKRSPKWYDCAGYPRKERAKVRSRTFMGVSLAMADQWGSL